MEEVVVRVIEVVVLAYLVSATLFVVRAIRGPTVFDRVLAVDALSYDLAVFMALLALYLGEPMIAIGAVVLTLWIYSLDIYISKYVESEGIGD